MDKQWMDKPSKHIDYLSSTGLQNKREIDRVHHETFHEWFRLHARSIRGKANRRMLRMLHTAGSKSHARVGHDMGVKTGRPPRRDEVFVETHKQKNGEIIPEAAETVEMLKEAVEVNPELKNKTIQEGDLYSRVCGTKEPRGRVRVLGKGPTPQDVGTPEPRSPVLEELHNSNQEVGKDVILYTVLRSDTPVAKATIVSIDPSSLVGGQPLGVEFYEVVVNVVLKRDALLPRPYDDMQTMADAQYTSIAWPNNRLNVSKRSAMSKSANSKSAVNTACPLIVSTTDVRSISGPNPGTPSTPLAALVKL
ncbi:hypothetical protein OsI_06888 [Oryza sativa Indica Group]|uniref:Transposase Tnp1/En/Spm-like domain-containing protein n=1 Tax=Oryza sativa subsp. indica TaxID=39946 RepID=B8AFZ5_ORYSI|nr:hypothetical protein OsI_06888 [Oryza sativa Indica Group]